MTDAAIGKVPAGTDSEIRRLCGYMRRDSDIAAYIGCSIAKVATIRRRLPQRHTPGGGVAKSRPPIDMSDDRFDAARQGSRQLRDAMIDLFERVARKHRIAPEQAQVLLLDGPRAAMRAAA